MYLYVQCSPYFPKCSGSLGIVNAIQSIINESLCDDRLGYLIDILVALKSAGYSTYRLRCEKIIGQKTIQDIRQGNPLTFDKLGVICRMLDCQPGDLLQYQKDDDMQGVHQ